MDYSSLGFKCGLEIHQQLEGMKLFCTCPTLNSSADSSEHVERKLRAVVGEQGKIDAAALAEMKKNKRFVYESDSADTCLIDFDEEPPGSMNPEAIAAAVQVAKMLNARIVDEIQVMRKIVVDGSNVSGFQRTSLVAMDGFIETSLGKVGIPSICLEEESGQKKNTTDDSVTYRIDRLGIPLIEIATDASIQSAEHAKETAEKIGLILRSIPAVKRGIGTIRQDVNVSITGHPRVEIKGFQDLKSIPKVIDFEIKRQQSEKSGESHVRKAEADGSTSFLRPMPGAARMYPETDVVPIRANDIQIEDVELISDRIDRYVEHGVNADTAKKIAKSSRHSLFDSLLSLDGLKAAFVADLLLSAEKNIKQQFGKEVTVSDEHFHTVLEKVASGAVSKDSILEVLFKLSSGEDVDFDSYKGMNDSEIEAAVQEIIAANSGAPMGALMGKAMAALRGKADGKKVSEIVKKLAQS